MSRSDLVEIEVIRAESVSKGAVLCLLLNGNDAWIPWSIIGAGSDIKELHDSGSVWVPKWFCDQNGILY